MKYETAKTMGIEERARTYKVDHGMQKSQEQKTLQRVG